MKYCLQWNWPLTDVAFVVFTGKPCDWVILCQRFLVLLVEMLHYLINIGLHTDWRLVFYSNVPVSWWFCFFPCVGRGVWGCIMKVHLVCLRSIWSELDELVYLYRGHVSLSRVHCERLLCTTERCSCCCLGLRGLSPQKARSSALMRIH